MKRFNHYEIGLPCSPASFVSKDIEIMSRVTISAGGGMGGSLWHEYGTIEGDVKDGGFVTITDAITKEEKTINTRFIVEVKEIQMVKVVCDTTKWVNYYKETCKKQTQTLYYWFPKTATISVKDDSFIDNDAIKDNLVKRITDEE